MISRFICTPCVTRIRVGAHFIWAPSWQKLEEQTFSHTHNDDEVLIFWRLADLCSAEQHSNWLLVEMRSRLTNIYFCIRTWREFALPISRPLSLRTNSGTTIACRHGGVTSPCVWRLFVPGSLLFGDFVRIPLSCHGVPAELVWRFGSHSFSCSFLFCFIGFFPIPVHRPVNSQCLSISFAGLESFLIATFLCGVCPHYAFFCAEDDCDQKLKSHERSFEDLP